MTDKRNNILILLAAIILILSWSNYNTINNLQMQVNNLNAELGSLPYHLSREVSHLSETIRQMQEDERWWKITEVDFLEVELEETLVRVEWQVREEREGQIVNLHYRQREDEEFTTISAISGNNGYYYADFGITVPVEPSWDIFFSGSDYRGEPYREERAKEINLFPRYEYYLSVTEGDTTYTSDLITLETWEVAHRLFNPLILGLHFNRETQITLQELRYDPQRKYQVETAYVEARMDNNVLAVTPLQLGDYPDDEYFEPEEIFFQATLEFEQYDSVYLIVKYNNGMLVEQRLDLYF